MKADRCATLGKVINIMPLCWSTSVETAPLYESVCLCECELSTSAAVENLQAQSAIWFTQAFIMVVGFAGTFDTQCRIFSANKWHM